MSKAASPADHYDLIVIGGGSGGLAGAFRAAAHGARVAMLEPAALGGTCVNVGCVPKKAMWLAADLGSRLRLARGIGFHFGQERLDWNELVARRQGYIANIHKSYRKRLGDAGITVIERRAQLDGQHAVRTEDGQLLHARHILLATGGRPVRPEISGVELGEVSDDFFHYCDAPTRIALVGAGYISVELAGVLQALGSKVEIFVRGQRLLQSFDAQLIAELEDAYQRHGVVLHLQCAVDEVTEAADGSRTVTSAGQHYPGFDRVLFATGRRPNSDDIGLESAGVACNAHGFVRVDQWQDTNVEGIHAVGDLTPQPALTPVAIAAARRLMDRLFGGDAQARLDERDIATVVFSHPPIGRIGLTEDEARQQHGDEVRVLVSRFRPMLHALADSNQHSLFKLICVGPERRVVGIHLLGEAADEILQGFAVAMKLGVTLADLHATIAIHPTSAEELVLMR